MGDIEFYEGAMVVSLTTCAIYLGLTTHYLKGIRDTLNGIYSEMKESRRTSKKDQGLEEKVDK